MTVCGLEIRLGPLPTTSLAAPETCSGRSGLEGTEVLVLEEETLAASAVSSAAAVTADWSKGGGSCCVAAEVDWDWSAPLAFSTGRVMYFSSLSRVRAGAGEADFEACVGFDLDFGLSNASKGDTKSNIDFFGGLGGGSTEASWSLIKEGICAELVLIPDRGSGFVEGLESIVGPEGCASASCGDLSS